jgi:hypothetical protein
VNHLPLADQIIAVDAEGKLECYVSFEQMENKSKIKAKLGTSCGHPPRKAPEPSTAKSPSPPKTQAAQKAAAESEKQRARRVGDLQSYSTYGRAMGYWRACLFLGIALLFAFCSRFSRKFILPRDLCAVRVNHHTTDYWVSWFTDNASINRPLFIGVYFLLALAATALSLVSFW